MIKISKLSFLKKYLIRAIFSGSAFFSILFLFLIQFKVDDLQNDLNQIENEIASYNQEIEILDTEWVYLSRPERLRALASEYLQNDDYLKVSQIKDDQSFRSYNMAKFKE